MEPFLAVIESTLSGGRTPHYRGVPICQSSSPFVLVGDHQLAAAQAAAREGALELGPESFGRGGADHYAENRRHHDENAPERKAAAAGVGPCPNLPTLRTIPCGYACRPHNPPNTVSRNSVELAGTSALCRDRTSEEAATAWPQLIESSLTFPTTD